MFLSSGISRVCDAACGFGAYTLALASNGFEVEAFDVSRNAVCIAREGLKKYGFDIEIKVAGITDTGYSDGEFDGVTACSVLDHLTKADAEKALAELVRITRPGGLILLTFDTAEEEDFLSEHEILPDGSMRYTGNSDRSGMIFRPHSPDMIGEFISGYRVVHRASHANGKQTVIIRK